MVAFGGFVPWIIGGCLGAFGDKKRYIPWPRRRSAKTQPRTGLQDWRGAGQKGHSSHPGEPWATGFAMGLVCPWGQQDGSGLGAKASHHTLHRQDFMFLLADFNNFIF